MRAEPGVTRGRGAAQDPDEGDARRDLVLEEVEAFRLRLPLRLPYHLAFGTLEEFELFLARVRVDGEEGIGECVPLPAYSHETAETVWAALRAVAPRLVGVGCGTALRVLEEGRERQPFATAPLMTAIETALDPGVAEEERRVPLLATVTGRDSPAALDEVERLLADGYTTLKVKVGWDPDGDAGWVRRVAERVAGRAVLRLDANQAYSFDDAWRFVTQVDPDHVEVFEQPFEPDAWEATSRLAARSPLPLMLDESIATRADLERLIDLRCAAAVKFKLAKAGGLRPLSRLIRRAREAGLKVVLGNGVAGDVDNFHELAAASRLIDTAGEMNGFLKPVTRLLADPYGVEAGHAVLPPRSRPGSDWERVAAHAVERLAVTVPASHSVR